MAIVDQLRAEKLTALCRERFDKELRNAEVAILVHSARFNDPADRPGRGPEGGLGAPEVRADFVRWLVTDADAADLVEHRGIRIWDVMIADVLDLRGCRLSTRLEFCRFSLIRTIFLKKYNFGRSRACLVGAKTMGSSRRKRLMQGEIRYY
jgi:hypothetical protein